MEKRVTTVQTRVSENGNDQDVPGYTRGYGRAVCVDAESRVSVVERHASVGSWAQGKTITLDVDAYDPMYVYTGSGSSSRRGCVESVNVDWGDGTTSTIPIAASGYIVPTTTTNKHTYINAYDTGSSYLVKCTFNFRNTSTTYAPAPFSTTVKVEAYVETEYLGS